MIKEVDSKETVSNLKATWDIIGQHIYLAATMRTEAHSRWNKLIRRLEAFWVPPHEPCSSVVKMDKRLFALLSRSGRIVEGKIFGHSTTD